MGLLDKLKGRTGTKEAAASTPPPSCLHTVLLPRWESVDDMGHDDRATSFRCDACSSEFSPQQALDLRATEAERLQLHTENPSLS